MGGNEVEIPSADGSFMGYMALPDDGPAPAVIVIQEVFGVNPPLRRGVEMFAAAGYVALAPDLFWRQQRGVQLDPTKDADFQKALEFYKSFDTDKGIADIQASIDHLRGHPGCNGKVGTVGYCLGGFLSYLAACRTDAEAHAGYYGVGIDRRLDEAAGMRGHLILHIADEDAFVSRKAQNRLIDGLHPVAKAQVYGYPRMEHGFARIGGDHYDADAAALANSRTLALFKTHLA